MKTILASIIALGLFAGAASASTVTPVQADNSVTGYCAPYYYGH
jgi:ABC-type nitrate/sulfonate/bicarbonate transport system substrate-binding protein